MRLQRLHVRNFSSVRNVTIEFGQGLNVLYGPNDLGKSSLVDAIRVALLLPHASSHADAYVPWGGTGAPFVELCFQTEEQRFWRVRKQLGKGGSSALDQSRNGQDFDDCERGRKVDGRIRELLGWGLQEPGGSGGAKSFPCSFLSTVLLSTQADVGSILRQTLDDDEVKSGRDQIAAALQAVSQDPLFVDLLSRVQAKHDGAFTEKGAKKQAKGSVFKVAADRVKAARELMESLQHVVSDSDAAEHQIRELTAMRDHRHQLLVDAKMAADGIETLGRQARDRAVAGEAVRVALEEVQRIEALDADIAAAEQNATRLNEQALALKARLEEARVGQTNAQRELRNAEDVLRQEREAPGVGDIVARQGLELKKHAAEHAIAEADQQIAAIGAAQQAVDNATKRTLEFEAQQILERSAHQAAADANVRRDQVDAELERIDRLERAVRLIEAERQLALIAGAVENKNNLELKKKEAEETHARLANRRGLLIVPAPETLSGIRRLDAEVAAARAALDLGMVVTVTPQHPLDLEIRKDGGALEQVSLATRTEIEVGAAAVISIRGVATFSIAAGRRDARELAASKEERWIKEVQPHLTSAGVADVHELEEQIETARGLDAALRDQASLIEALTGQLLSLGDPSQELTVMSGLVEAARNEAHEVVGVRQRVQELGADPAGALRTARAQLASETAAAHIKISETGATLATVTERLRQCQTALDESVVLRDALLAAFPQGVADALTTAQTARAIGLTEDTAAVAALKELERSVDDRKARIDAQMKGAADAMAVAGSQVENLERVLEAATKDHLTEEGRLAALRAHRATEDLGAAQSRLSERTAVLAGLPIPARIVTPVQLAECQAAVAEEQAECGRIERDLQRAHGALEQVGGAVARERLRDAEEAFLLAERLDRETEADSEAWKLLLEQMKEAEAAQASNLGEAFVPAVTAEFRALTRQRYEGVQLTPEMGTEGVLVGGAVRSHDRLSVGTREQLSTLYRLALADYLKTALVLDDQLVQSDDTRMEWFRKVLAEKARQFQIVVFTCRPDDYLTTRGRAPSRGPFYKDSKDAFVRAFDLGRALQ